ncbi:MAG: hypothetical protein ACI9VR_000564 [Cognaticolwellia sp.]|jgi:hypothetical protein
MSGSAPFRPESFRPESFRPGPSRPAPSCSVSSRTERFREYYRENLPADYDGWRQQRRITAAMLGTALLLALGVQDWTWTLLGVAAAVCTLSCAGEYLAHRFPMHRPVRGLEFMFRRHVRVHHRYFTNQQMAGGDARDVHATVLAPVQLLVLLLVGALPLSMACWILVGPDAARICAVSIFCYLNVFEWVHLACHLPQDHPAVQLPFLQRAREHHRLHHNPRHMGTQNFQISNPWTDLPLGTRIESEPPVERDQAA